MMDVNARGLPSPTSGLHRRGGQAGWLHRKPSRAGKRGPREEPREKGRGKLPEGRLGKPRAVSAEIPAEMPREKMPHMDPRFRRRWIEARRAEGRRRLRVLIVAVSVVALAGLGLGLLYSPLFRVRNVIVVGDVHTTRVQLLAAAGLSAPSRVLMVDVGSARERQAVEALPWVASVTIEKRWPWTVVLSVRERRPVALVSDGKGEAVVDSAGRVLEVGSPPKGLPPLPTVLGANASTPGSVASPVPGTSPKVLSELFEVAAACPVTLARLGLQVSDGAGGELVAKLRGRGPVVLLGDATNVGEKLAILEELEGQVDLAHYSEVDLTVPQRPALTPSVNSPPST